MAGWRKLECFALNVTKYSALLHQMWFFSVSTMLIAVHVAHVFMLRAWPREWVGGLLCYVSLPLVHIEAACRKRWWTGNDRDTVFHLISKGLSGWGQVVDIPSWSHPRPQSVPSAWQERDHYIRIISLSPYSRVVTSSNEPDSKL